MQYPHFVGGSYPAHSPSSDQEKTINWFVEPSQVPSQTSSASLYPTPGVSLLGTATTGPGRALYFDATTQRLFAVIGSTFWEISSSGTLTSRGTVATDSNPATICSNGDGGGQLLITSGGNAYSFVLSSNTFAAIAALAGIATMGDYLDGYGLVLDVATSTVRISDLLDFTTWDPTQYFQRSIAGDPWVSMRVSNRYIRLLGSETSESWYDTGASPIPFAPDPASLIQYGCAAAFSPEVVGNALIWLGASASGKGPVLRMTGLAAEPISTFALDQTINGYSSISDAIGDTEEDRGHVFYRLTFPSADATHVYDANTQLWAERGTWDEEVGAFHAWRPLYHALAFGEHWILDRNGAGAYRLSSSYGTDVEDLPIRRMRRAPALVFENERLVYPGFELDLEPGLGLSTGQGSDPQVMMRFSDDGGKNWSNEHWRSAGAIGEYKRRVRWLRCGAARRRVFEISVSDPIPWRVTNAYLPGFALPRRA